MQETNKMTTRLIRGAGKYKVATKYKGGLTEDEEKQLRNICFKRGYTQAQFMKAFHAFDQSKMKSRKFT